MIKNTIIHSKLMSYQIMFHESLTTLLCSEISQESRIFAIVDNKLPSQVFQSIKDSCSNSVIYAINGGENAKSYDVYLKTVSYMLENEIARSDTLLAIGGGTILDLAGFVASTYKRGMKYISAPTTTLSMIDAAIGGKNGINYSKIKNVLGTIYPPKKILIGFDVLNTLEKRHYSNGIFESLKMALCFNKDFYNALISKDELDVREIIYQSILIKKTIVERDEFEENDRKLLNYGHTFGHALEEIYCDKLLHGEAIANGMLIASKNQGFSGDLMKFLKKYNCPIINDLRSKELIEKIKNDKKAHDGTIDFVIVEQVGECKIKNISLKKLERMVN